MVVCDRVRKRAIDRANAAAVVIQALIRGVLGRCEFKRNYKKLVREREKRIKLKRVINILII